MTNKLTTYPKKKSINFVVDNTEKYNKISLVCFGLFLIVLVVFTKFAVIDTLSAINKMESEYNSYLSQIEAYNAKMSDYDEVETRYNELVGDFLTQDEKVSASRIEIVDMINKDFGGFKNIQGYVINGQNVIVNAICDSINEVSKTLEVLQNDPHISFATCKSVIYTNELLTTAIAQYDIIYDTVGGNK